jgi:hypothetical protein
MRTSAVRERKPRQHQSPLETAASSVTPATTNTDARHGFSLQNMSVYPPGQPLAEAVRTPMENAFGVDFADVRVHESPRPAEVGVWAYTLNDDIHFEPGRYQPDTAEGSALLGHELTHVVQQRQAGFNTDTHRNRDAGLEAEADNLGSRAARGEPVAVTGSASGVQAKGPDDSKGLYSEVVEAEEDESEFEDSASESSDERDLEEIKEEIKGQYVENFEPEEDSESEEPEHPINPAFARRFDQFFAERNARMNERREEPKENLAETKKNYVSDIALAEAEEGRSLASSAEIVNEGKQEASDSEEQSSDEEFADFFAQRRKRMAQAEKVVDPGQVNPYSEVAEGSITHSSQSQSMEGRERSDSGTVYTIPTLNQSAPSSQPEPSKKVKKIHKKVAKGVKKLEKGELPRKENGAYTNTKSNNFGDTRKTDWRGNEYVEPGEREKFQIMFKEDSGVKERTKYLSEEERAKYEVSVDNQGLVHQQAYANSGSDLMDTSNAAAPTFAGSSSGRFIVVMDKTGQIYAMDSQREMFQPEAILKQEDLETVKKTLAAKLRQQAEDRKTDSSLEQPTLERIHHSTAIAGEDAAAAGEIEIKNGRIVAISDVSGHYKPTPEMMFQLTQELTSRNPDALRDTSVDETGKPINKPAKIELIGKHLDHGVKKETALAKGITLTSDQFAQTYGNETGIRLKKDLNKEIESKHVEGKYDEQKMADIEARLEERRKAQRDLSAEEFSQMSDQLQGMGVELEEAVAEGHSSSDQPSSPDASGYDPVPLNFGALNPSNLDTTGYDPVPRNSDDKRGYGVEIPTNDNPQASSKGYGVPIPVNDNLETPKSVGYGVPFSVNGNKPSAHGYNVPIPVSSNPLNSHLGYVGDDFSSPSPSVQQGRSRGYGVSYPAPDQAVNAPVAQQPAQQPAQPRGNIIARAINWVKRKLGFN